MSINNFEDFIRGEEFNKVIFDEYDFIEISNSLNCPYIITATFIILFLLTKF